MGISLAQRAAALGSGTQVNKKPLADMMPGDRFTDANKVDWSVIGRISNPLVIELRKLGTKEEILVHIDPKLGPRIVKLEFGEPAAAFAGEHTLLE